jgi:hypothetical protein
VLDLDDVDMSSGSHQLRSRDVDLGTEPQRRRYRYAPSLQRPWASNLHGFGPVLFLIPWMNFAASSVGRSRSINST